MAGVGFDFDSFDRLDEPAKREVKAVLGDIVDNWDDYDVGDLERNGDNLAVELHHQDKSIVGRRKITVEVDHNP